MDVIDSLITYFLLITSEIANIIAANNKIKTLEDKDKDKVSKSIININPKNPNNVAKIREIVTFSFKIIIENRITNNGIVKPIIEAVDT